jgi:outer membrane protein, multidrug efflux system
VISAHQALGDSLKQQARSVSAYQESVRLANTRYDSGLASYFEVIDAKLDLYPAQQFEIQYDLERKVSLVNLYMALGGGWKLSDADWMQSPQGTPPNPSDP